MFIDEGLIATEPNVNPLRPRQMDAISQTTFSNQENARISLKISLTFVPKVRINNILALVQIMDWHRPSDKPLSEPMLVSFLTHICVTRPQWVNSPREVTGCSKWTRASANFLCSFLCGISQFHSLWKRLCSCIWLLSICTFIPLGGN